MRIALLPLDSRPPSWQSPLRIAQVARAELIHPQKEKLGTLHQGADQRYLLEWLQKTAREADAAILSWDALVYGGLVQSRTEGEPLHIGELVEELSKIDWQRCAGYLWLTIPRLGMTIASQEQWGLHKLLAEYFTLWGKSSKEQVDDKALSRLRALELQIGPDVLSRAWWLRRRNLDSARTALKLAADLGFRTCHIAVEDNARTGPHLEELEELRKLSLELTVEAKREGHEPPRFTFFDGTDECGSLLTARAILDHHNAPPIPVKLTLFPSTPTPDKYFGLYESHSLEDGLHFLAKLLGIEFRAQGRVQWLVCFGKQPQPDAFAGNPEEIFANPLLVPPRIEGGEPLFVADLQACNGGNPELLTAVGEMAGERLMSVSAWNTNFNALGFSAAVLAVACLPQLDAGALRQLLVERVGDDYIYQSAVRSSLREICVDEALDPLDLSTAPKELAGRLTAIATEAVGGILLNECPFLQSALRGMPGQIADLTVSFPWNRLFEIEIGGLSQNRDLY